MNKMIETILEVNSDWMCLFKIGSFYHCFGKDAYILSYIFNYKIKEIGSNHKDCGFPIGVLPKIKAKLENIGISYIVIDSRNNYYVDEQFDNGNNNKYQTMYSKAKRTVNYKI